MKFHTTLLQADDMNATGIVIPSEVIESLGAGKRPPVTVTLNGKYSYRNTIAVMGGQYMVGVSAEHRAGAGVKGGDEIDVELELDTAPRVVNVPEDFKAALDSEPEARRFFDSLSYSHKSRHVLAIEDAKTPETRQRRIEKAIAMLRESKK